jgi:hypothetical protein
MPYLKETVKRLKKAAPMAEDYGIRLALENHCDSFSEEILWVLKEVNHPFVGACIDTVNAWHVTEDPMIAIENLAPVAFTNHFRDDRVEFCRDGFRVKGVAVGDGDIDMKKAYEIIKRKSPANRINIETEMGISLQDKEEALRLELEAVKKDVIQLKEEYNIKNTLTGKTIFNNFVINNAQQGLVSKEVFEGIYKVDEIVGMAKEYEHLDHTAEDSITQKVAYLKEDIVFNDVDEVLRSLPKSIYRVKGVVKVKDVPNPIVINYSFGNESFEELEEYAQPSIMIFIGQAIDNDVNLLCEKFDFLNVPKFKLSR